MLTKNQILKLAAIFSLMSLLGACASTGGSGTPQYPLERLGKSVTETGNRIWDGTRYLFKLKDSDDTIAEGDLADEYFDEFDTEVFDEIEISDVDAAGVEKPLDLASLGTAITTDVSPEIAEEAVEVTEIPTSNEDLFHTVGENESLWELAKMLTGNANNWRALAEINDLGESGSVYVGQRIRIPADMKRVPLDEDLANDNQPAAAEPEIMQAKADDEAESKPMMAAETSTGDTEEFEVLAGESLWFFAKRTTGSPANWTKIAQANDMSESQANNLRFGQTIKVPADLIADGVAGQTAAAEPAMNKTPEAEAALAVADAIQLGEGDNSDAKVALAAATDKPAAAEDDIKIVEANFQSEPPKELELAKRADDLLADQQGEAATEEDGDAVMVSGTYYPKAIYNEANFSSSLLMRVSPGTKLTVSKAVGPWFEVVTDKGVGYVHSRDTK